MNSLQFRYIFFSFIAALAMLLFVTHITTVFAQSVTISGTIFASDRVTVETSEPLLRLAVGGVMVATTTAASDGTYTFANVSSSGSGETLTIFIDETGLSGAVVTLDEGTTSVSDVDVYIDHVTLQHENSGPVSNSDLDHFDSLDNSAVPFTVNGSSLTIASGHTFFIPGSYTYQPSGDVVTPRMHLAGSYEAGSNTLEITSSGEPFTLEAGGQFVADTSTVTYTGTSATQMAGVTYYNLRTEPTSGTPIYTFASGSVMPDIAGLRMHVDATAITGLNNNDSVSSWADLSGSGNPLTQGTAAQQPLYQTNIINGLPAVRFNGNQWLRNNMVYNQPGQLFVVFQQDGGTTERNLEILFDGRAGEGAGNIIFMELWNSGTNWRAFTSNAFTFPNPGSAADNFGILNVLYNTNSSVARFNGTQLGTGNVGTGELRGSTLGADRNDGRAFNGYVAEVLFYDQALSSAEQTAVEEYLDAKWLGGTGGATVLVENDLTLSDASATVTLDLLAEATALTVNGELLIDTNQTLEAASSTALTVGGDFINSGTFTHNNGEVVFSGTDQTLNGNTTFYDFTKITNTSDTFTFAANSTTVIENEWTMQGVSSNVLSLRSSVSGTQWQVDPQGVRSLAYLDVQDSENLNATEVDATGTDMVNGGNNTGWQFASNTISGTAYESDRITASETGSEIRLAVDGQFLATTTADTNDGSFIFTGLDSITAGTPITIYYAGGVESGAVVDRHPGIVEYDEVALYDAHVTIATGDNGSLSNTQIAHFDGVDDTDIPFTVVGTSLNIDAGQLLYVAVEATYAPSGDITTPELLIAGTLTAGSSVITVTNSDSPFSIATNGEFDAETSTVVYTGIANTSIFPTTYYNLETNPASGNPNYFFREGATLPIRNSLVLHLDATTISGVADGDPVSQWDDISGNDNHALDWSGVPNPIFKTNQINGQPVLRYSGSEGLLVSHDASLSTGNVFTIFAVVDLEATTSGNDNIRTIVSKENNFDDRNYWLVHWDGEWRGRVSDGGAPRTVDSDANSATSPTTLSYQANGTDLRMWVDNVEQSTVTTYNNIDNQNSPLGIGRQADNQRSWDGDIAEIIIFDTDLTASNRQAVEDYLNVKWFGVGTGGAEEVEIRNNFIMRSNGGTATVDLFAENDEITIGGDLIIEVNQTLSAASSSPLYVGGTFNTSGTFLHNQGTVIFNGSDQGIIGNTVFYNFSKVSTSSDVFTFAASSATAIENEWTMQGAENQPLALRSSAPGTQWQINPQGTRNLAYLDIEDSLNANSVPIDALADDLTNSGNNVNWLFELVSDFFVQRGTIEISGTSTTLVAGDDYTTPENPNNTLVRITNSSMTGAGATSDGGTQTPENVTVAITDASDITSSITFSRFGDNRDTYVDWEIIEYVGIGGGDNELVVRDSGVVTFSGSDSQGTGAVVSGVQDDSDVAIFITGYRNPSSSTSEYNAGLATAAWNPGAQQPVFTREATDASGVEVSYVVVEFTGSNWRVQRTEHQYTSGGVAETESITAVNSLSRTFLEAQKRVGSTQIAVNEYGHEVWLSSIGAVSFRIDNDVSTPDQHISVAWVIENTQTGDGAMQVYRSNGTLADAGIIQPQTLDVNIGATVSLSESSLWINARSSGINLSFPRPIIGARIISDTQYRVWNSDGGGAQTFRTEVLTWPTAQPSFVQNTYRFYVDNDTLTPDDPHPPGSESLGENMSITLDDEPLGLNDRTRIRMSIQVAEATLPLETRQFKLQYGERNTSCENVNFWNDLGNPGSGAVWRGFDGSPDSGTALSGNPPTAEDLLLSTSDRAGTYQEQNPTPVNPYTVLAGDSVEFDWHIEHNGATQDTDYCFRMVEADGTTFSEYDVYPTIRTAPFAPQIVTWRWFDDIDNLTPSSPLAGELVTPTDVQNQATLSLRVAVREIYGALGENVKFAIQYSEYSDFKDGGTFPVSSSACVENSLWCYANGAGSDNAVLDEAILSASDSCTSGSGTGCGTYNEAATTTSTFTHQPFATTEYEFTLRQAGARVNAVYYFRLYDVTNDRPLTASSSNPNVAVEGAQLVFTVAGVAENTTIAGVVTDVSTTPNTISFTEVPFNVSRVAAHELSVDTNATDGYQVLMFTDQQPTNVYGDIIPPVSGTNQSPSSWALGCDVTVQTGCFGYHTTDATLEGGSTRFSAFDTYAGLSTTPAEVMYSAVPASSTAHIVYRMEIGVLQAAGDYETDIGFLAIPRF